MLSTMAQSPLTVAQILRYAVDEHGDRSVTTATREGCRKITYSELGNQASRLANGLRRMGITGDERVATFMWNNQEHVIPFS
jgi:fatty-acyl-CoA synthase